METENAFSAICTGCGMCCDGTLFDKASVKNEADELLAQSFGLKTFKNAHGKSFFRLPCHHFEGCCTVYAQTRPRTCGAYYCYPLKMVQKGDLSLADARTFIEQALALRAEILVLAAQIGVFKEHPIADLMKEIRPKPSLLLQKYPTLWIKMIAFEVACSKIVGSNKRDDVPQTDGT